MCVNIYIYTYICIYIYICLSAYNVSSETVWLYQRHRCDICIYLNEYVHVYVIFVYMFMYVYVYIYIYIPLCVQFLFRNSVAL